MAKAKPIIWQNRIIGEGEESPEQLLANPANWRGHPKHQQDVLTDVLSTVGWVQKVIVNKRTGFCVDGHLRIALAITHNQPTIPVTYVDLDDAEESLILATFDPISALAFTDAQKLDELLRDVQTDSAAVQQMLSELAANSGLIPPDNPYDEWKGMPEFEQENAEAPYHVEVRFMNERDMQSFSQLIGQTVTGKSRAIYFPKQVNEKVIYRSE